VTGPLLAITLDLDDTLWPSRPVLLHAEHMLSTWLAEHAPATLAWLDADRRRALRAQLLADHPQRAHDVSFLRLESLRRSLREAGDDPALAEPAFEVFLDARQQVSPYDDVEPVLARWSQRYRLVAVSNGNANVARTGLGRYFAASVSAHQLDFGKPDPRIFAEACRRAGVDDPSAVLHVGDDLDLDVLAARAAGLQAAWIRRPGLADEATGSARVGEPASFEDIVFEGLAELDAALHR